VTKGRRCRHNARIRAASPASRLGDGLMALDLGLGEDAFGDTVIVLRGDLDVYTVRSFRSQTDQLRLGDSRMTIDLTEVDFIDSSGLGALARLATERTPELICPNPRLSALFSMTGLDRLFVVVQEASDVRELGGNEAID
jgi:anti-sigma B factor antagonist